MRRALGLALLSTALIASSAAGGCAWKFDEDDPVLPLVGGPPAANTLRKLNQGPVYSSAIVRGADQAYWLSLQEESRKLRLLRLSEPAAEATLEGDQFLVTWRTFFVWSVGDAPADTTQPRPATLYLSSAGEAEQERVEFPLGLGTLVVGGSDDLFAYSAPDPSTSDASFEIHQRRTGLLRTAPLISADNHALGGAFFSSDGQWFYERAPCGTRCPPPRADIPPPVYLVAHAVREERDLTIGLVPQQFIYYESAGTKNLVTCGADGVRFVPIEASADRPARTLDETACSADYFALQRVPLDDKHTRIEVFYTIGSELRRVPLDGSEAPRRALDYPVERVLGIYDPSHVVYSKDPGDRFIYGVGDGWLGDWRFMNRGRGVDLDIEKGRVHFLENAAQGGGIGDLSAAAFGGSASVLARNVYQYDQIADGRILAAANHAFRGTQNRVIVIDEAKGEARWVADQATRYSFVPGSDDLLVDIVTGASSYDLVRVPIPPPVE